MTSLPWSGFFITLEGGEGAGKSSLLRALASYLRNKGYEVVTTQEPGGSKLGEKIREWLLQKKEAILISNEAELLLFLAARAQHIQELIFPALKAGKIVLCDRFNDSTIAYQGGAREIGIDYVQQLCTSICAPVLPQLTLLLKVDPKTGLSRAQATNKEHAAKGTLDRIEAENLAFHCKIQETFDQLARQEPQRIHTIDANQTQTTVFQAACALLDAHLSPLQRP